MKLKVAGAELVFDVRGDGSDLLFLHAFPLGLAMWEAQAEALEGSHRVIRFDARGFGGSPPGDGLLTMERIADDAAALLDHLGVSRAAVCGLSMGGYAAFAMVRRHADRLRGLVLADTRSAADTPESRQNRSALAEKVLKAGAGAAADAFVPKLLGETTHRERRGLVARLREVVMRNPPRGIADALAGLAAPGRFGADAARDPRPHAGPVRGRGRPHPALRRRGAAAGDRGQPARDDRAGRTPREPGEPRGFQRLAATLPGGPGLSVSAAAVRRVGTVST